jgi:hypothetical protein
MAAGSGLHQSQIDAPAQFSLYWSQSVTRIGIGNRWSVGGPGDQLTLALNLGCPPKLFRPPIRPPTRMLVTTGPCNCTATLSIRLCGKSSHRFGLHQRELSSLYWLALD